MSRLLDSLRRLKEKDDRGMMANLRCVLVENKKHRAWPALNRIGIAVSDDISAFIAGLFATHPEETDKGNFGDTCHAIELNRGETRNYENKITPTERRFQHLLNAERNELNGRVLRVVRMAKSQGVPVNYECLINDLRYWNDQVKIKWADAFWGQGAAVMPKEDA